MSRLRRLAAYERPWVGRVGLALIVALWLLFTVVGFASSMETGLAFLVVGAASAVGEVWIARSGGDTTFALVWYPAWRIGLGTLVIVLGAIKSDGWAVALPAVFGALMMLSGLLVLTLWVLQEREADRDGRGLGERNSSEDP